MDVTLDGLATEIGRLTANEMPLGAVALLDIDGLGGITIDGTTAVNTVSTSPPAAPADVTIAMDAGTLAGLVDGSVDAGTAFTQGRIAVTGRMDVAMTLASFWDTGDPY